MGGGKHQGKWTTQRKRAQRPAEEDEQILWFKPNPTDKERHKNKKMKKANGNAQGLEGAQAVRVRWRITQGLDQLSGRLELTQRSGISLCPLSLAKVASATPEAKAS